MLWINLIHLLKSWKKALDCVSHVIYPPDNGSLHNIMLFDDVSKCFIAHVCIFIIIACIHVPPYTLNTILTCFYMIYRYMFSKWKSIRLVEINQYDITIAPHCEITMGNDARDIHCGVTISNAVAMCTYHGWHHNA